MKVKVESKIGSLAFDPMQIGAVKLSGFVSTYRIRVGDYRIVYKINDDENLVMIQKVAHRKEVYK